MCAKAAVASLRLLLLLLLLLLQLLLLSLLEPEVKCRAITATQAHRRREEHGRGTKGPTTTEEGGPTAKQDTPTDTRVESEIEDDEDDRILRPYRVLRPIRQR